MKKLNQLLLLGLFFTAFSFTSCKSKSKSDNAAPATISADSSLSPSATTPAPAPVVVSNDNALQTGLTDALKDHPSVKGDVSDSVINLSGDIKRADWQKLVQTLNSLHPKRINSDKLTIK